MSGKQSFLHDAAMMRTFDRSCPISLKGKVMGMPLPFFQSLFAHMAADRRADHGDRHSVGVGYVPPAP